MPARRSSVSCGRGLGTSFAGSVCPHGRREWRGRSCCCSASTRRASLRCYRRPAGFRPRVRNTLWRRSEGSESPRGVPSRCGGCQSVTRFIRAAPTRFRTRFNGPNPAGGRLETRPVRALKEFPWTPRKESQSPLSCLWQCFSCGRGLPPSRRRCRARLFQVRLQRTE